MELVPLFCGTIHQLTNSEVMTKMSKSRKENRNQKALVVKKLSEHFGVSLSYVYGSVKGDFKNETAEEIKKEYNRLMKAIDNVFKG